ncbi:glycosyltransferase [Planctomicrobium sp. SH664]|uniref:glycosyltransferase n=1 Tax=Planctomicrobium sp. SH664 TaxID=3448125 RepID=UPI003F5C278B
MTKFVLTTIGSSGDVFPMVGLALQLRQRGHDVLLVTNGHFAPLAEKYNLPFEPLGMPEEYSQCISSPDLWHPQKAFRHVYSYFRPQLKRQHEILVEQNQNRRVVAIASCLCFGARVAQESHGIPLLTVHLQPSVIWSDLVPPTIAGLAGPRWFKSLLFRFGEKFAVDAVVCPFLNEWRRELRLSPIRQITRWWNSPEGVLCLFPDWFAPPQADWPHRLIQTDFPLWNDQSEQPLDREIEHFLHTGEPPIVFTPGSANLHGRAFFETALQTVQSTGHRALFLTQHPEQVPNVLPPTVRHFAYAPLDRLLPQAAAFVHHGGIGSTSQALLAGIPQVAMPLAHDQFDNAARIESLQVGRGLPARAFKAPALTSIVSELLGSTAVANACQTMRERLASRSGLADSVAAIEARFCEPRAI